MIDVEGMFHQVRVNPKNCDAHVTVVISLVSELRVLVAMRGLRLRN